MTTNIHTFVRFFSSRKGFLLFFMEKVLIWLCKYIWLSKLLSVFLLPYWLFCHVHLHHVFVIVWLFILRVKLRVNYQSIWTTGLNILFVALNVFQIAALKWMVWSYKIVCDINQSFCLEESVCIACLLWEPYMTYSTYWWINFICDVLPCLMQCVRVCVCVCRGLGGRERVSFRARAQWETETPAQTQRTLSVAPVWIASRHTHQVYTDSLQSISRNHMHWHHIASRVAISHKCIFKGKCEVHYMVAIEPVFQNKTKKKCVLKNWSPCRLEQEMFWSRNWCFVRYTIRAEAVALTKPFLGTAECIAAFTRFIFKETTANCHTHLFFFFFISDLEVRFMSVLCVLLCFSLHFVFLALVHIMPAPLITLI